jgi:hypothetical protein
MTTFVFLLSVVNLQGDYSTFVIDYNLTESDCTQLVESWNPTLDSMSFVTCEKESNNG